MIVLTAIFLSILCGLGAQKCGKYYSTRVSYKTNCGFMGWQRCTNHITKRRYKEYCCPGYTSYPDCRPLDRIGIIPKAVFEDEKSAKTFLSRHKRSLSEECREGCYWEEVDEAYRNTERTKEYMINYKCRGACTSGYFCHATGTYGHINYLQVQCLPICNGLTSLTNACNKLYPYDMIYYRTGNNRNSGAGFCSSPGQCSNCADGFYSYGGECLICPSITNCYHRRCTTASDNHCEWCKYEIIDKRYYRGYTRHYDGSMKQCRKACSWRSDSTRCYPGICSNEIVESCRCTSGFGGAQCTSILEETSILYAELKLHNPSGETVTTPADPTYISSQSTKFTNKKNLTKAEMEFHAKFVTSGIPPRLHADHFVTYFNYGIVYGQMKITFVVGSSITGNTYSCPASEYNPIQTGYVCSRTIRNNSDISLPNLGHSDKLIFIIVARNGGYLRYLNREHSPPLSNYVSLSGKTTTRNYVLQMDYEDPYFPCPKQFQSPIHITDITDQNLISFTWDPWVDDLSGIDYYAYQVFKLTVYGAVLTETSNMLYSFETTVQRGEFNLTDPDMYAIILTAFDKAGNNKSARALLFFDNLSEIEKQSGTRIAVVESTVETNTTWIILETSQLHVTWHNRFINKRHHLNGWLFPVGNNSHVDSLYDDYYGQRTVGWITNIRGIVKFDIKYIVSGPDVKANQEYTNVEDILPETEILNVFWDDGQKLDISVKATDIFGQYNEDSITVYKDSSGPLVENVWLTYGNKTNKTDFYVHRIEDLSDMIIEWDAFDYHSGLHSVHWKMYHNFTGDEVVWGNSFISAQGNAENMTACEDLYGAAPRGYGCYCTLYHGCFHRHFYVEPEIVLRSDLIPKTDEGSSDFDYFLEITVVNSAQIATVITRKMHVDKSPPHDETELEVITCNGLTYSNGGCNESYLYDGIYYRGGGSRNSGGGNCSAPEQCTDCQDGFYASAGQCLICPLITNCNHRRCTTTSDNYCEWCKYEIMDQRYYRGYTRHYDGSMKQCRKACSWRSDSTRCYPGECGQEIVESCVCTSGFGGAQCDTITEETSIVYAEIKLHSPAGEVVTTPIDPNDTDTQSIIYTNRNTFNKAEIEFHANFVTSGIPPPLHADHYVTSFSYGIIYGQMKVEFVIGSLSSNYTYSCPATEDFPIKSNYVCSRKSHNNSEVYLPKFGHNDKLIFTIEARNGGYLQYLNRDYSPALSNRTSLKGITTKRSYVVQWDYVDPYFPSLHLLKSPFNTVDDITEQNLIRFTWDSWRDDLSGIDYYTYQVYQLTVYGAVLREKSEPLYSYKTTAQMGEISLTDPGMYSVILTAFDKAGNNKSARSLLLFDDQSVVEKQSKTRIVVAEMTTENNKTWMISEASQLNVTWHNTFINKRHHLNGWLLPVGTNSHVDNLYDDYYGRRTVGWMTNIRGIVKFEIKYIVSGPDVIANQEYTNVEDILPEAEMLNVFWNDGQKLDISVKATDIFEKYIEDSITVYKDSSGPIVENIWLTYGNKTNKTDFYIHRIEDLSKSIIEWDAFDYHSGLHSVHWKLYNYLTGNEVLHGNSSISAQGNAENMAACEDLYGAAPRGYGCYCTLYHGCFHRHFYVEPEIVLRTDLISKTEEGSSDFFLEITVFNSAKISTVLTRKIHVNESPPPDGTGLDAINCNGLTYSNGACNEPYLYDGIYYRGGGSRNSGEGNCSAPEQCTNCQDGFYALAGQCLICPSITNCNHRRCTTTSDNYCEWCKHEIMDQRYYRGYTRHYDGSMKQCRKTCSWRSDSTRCYPGECGQEIVESCVCTSGFGGAQCDTITEETSILYAEITMHSPSGEVVTTPFDPNETHIQSTSYTNKNTLNKAEIEFHAKFVTSGIPPPLHADHYVTNFSYGIIYGQMKIEFVIGSLSINYTYSCPATEDFPIKLNYVCSRTSHNNSEVYLPNFGHNDKLIFTIEARNGGNIQYLNRDYSPALSNRTSLKGITTKRSYVVQWDYVDPYFPSLHLLKSPFNIITDITEQNLVSFSWDSWRDDSAGIDYYAYQVYQLTVNSAVLREKSKPLYSYKTTAQMGEYNLTDPGMYSVILTAFDKAGNNKSARSLLFFDDQSVVEKQPKSGISVAEMTTENNKSWIISDASQLNVTWHNSFINERHHLNGWLLPVGTNSHVDNLYDDVYGRRTAGRITNIRGIVKFDIRYTVSGPGVIANQEYTNVEDILLEAEILNVFWDDGQKLDISVKATDIFEKYIEDSITVYKDSSGPILENLWLTYGNKTNKTDFSVHRIDDLSEMIIEWDAFDYHSGLQSVHWKIYHNFSGNEVLHGNVFISAQGNAENMAACEGLNGVAPRGSDCYCTLYHGCFHRHFYVKPEIVFRTCLLPRTDKGISGLDYFLEITVVNSAKIATVLTRKIHVDGSPPHDGTVPDDNNKHSSMYVYQENAGVIINVHVGNLYDGFSLSEGSGQKRKSNLVGHPTRCVSHMFKDWWLPTYTQVKAPPTQPEQEISPPLPSVPSSCFDYQTSFKEGDRV